MNNIPEQVLLAVIENYNLKEREKKVEHKEIVVETTLDKLDKLLGNIEASLDRFDRFAQNIN